jgi:hypothetical protein
MSIERSNPVGERREEEKHLAQGQAVLIEWS